MIVGITATRQGLTVYQQWRLSRALADPSVVEAHHGDCIGGDAEFHALCKEHGVRVVVHPPINPKLRAFCAGDTILPEDDYLARNRSIVNAVDLLFVCPKENAEPAPARGQGTWSAARYARSINKPTDIIWPNPPRRQK